MDETAATATPTPTPAISWPLNRATQRTPWSPTTSHANGHANTAVPLPGHPPPTQPEVDASLLPSGPKSLAGISLRAAFLGTTFGFTSLTTILLAASPLPLWRAPFFLATLSLFHFLEFYVTARYNTPVANISAFLLSQNGWAYNVAHTCAFIECILTHTFFSYHILPNSLHYAVLGLGFTILVMGQVTRSTAMAQAGTNFNHTVQMQKKYGHELVTDGMYAWLRHPSYFGFFWWGLGTQVVLGNVICFAGYAVVLWGFFKSRITREEELLIKFFGEDYAAYRERTRVGIPLIR
ncbi:hypothetical protein MMC30_003205 [Trapelia coarctata]|nr:hypothetical protein [Trapelia coarctata]